MEVMGVQRESGKREEEGTLGRAVPLCKQKGAEL
jgi:hypothetical protein